jgi:hypothetical protein
MMILSQLLWETLLEEFRWPRRTVERVAYIDGYQCGETEIAVTVTLPNAAMYPTHFTVSGDAMSQAGNASRCGRPTLAIR